MASCEYKKQSVMHTFIQNRKNNVLHENGPTGHVNSPDMFLQQYMTRVSRTHKDGTYTRTRDYSPIFSTTYFPIYLLMPEKS